jgi:hypothetical protein
MMCSVSNDRPSDVLGALPRRRPHRRSDKRAAPAPADGSAVAQAAPPAGSRLAAAKRISASDKPAASAPGQPASTADKRASAPGKRASTARTRGPAGKASASTRRKQPPPAPAVPIRSSDATARTAAPPRASRRQPERLRQPAQPAGFPTTPVASRPEPASRRRVLGTAAQAAAELAEIGLSVSARALRNAVARLPRP